MNGMDANDAVSSEWIKVIYAANGHVPFYSLFKNIQKMMRMRDLEMVWHDNDEETGVMDVLDLKSSNMVWSTEPKRCR